MSVAGGFHLRSARRPPIHQGQEQEQEQVDGRPCLVAAIRPRVGSTPWAPRRRWARRTWTVAFLLALWTVASGPSGVTGAVFSGATGNLSNTLTAASVFPRCYSDAVTADGPASYWRLDETSGTNAADSAGSQTGTYRN